MIKSKMRAKDARNAPLVVVLAYDQLCTFEFGCAVEVFALDRPELNVDWYKFAVHAVDKGPLRAGGQITVQARSRPGLLKSADIIIIPGWRGLEAPVPPSLIKALRLAHARGAKLCSICSGVVVLAASGLLDGRAVTTHWRYAERMAHLYPGLILKTEALYVEDGNIVTAAGSAAGLDMMLHLVRQDYGARVANQVAQRLVIAPHREAGQAQFVAKPLSRENDGRLSKLLDWMRSNLHHELALETLAERAFMSVRSLQRAFSQALGLSPTEWLNAERLALAKDLLETSRLTVAQIAEKTGLGSEETLRHHFRRRFDTNPTSYRKQFSRLGS